MLTAISSLAGHLAARRDPASRIVIQERAGIRITSVAARRGKLAALRADVLQHWNIDLPERPRRAANGDVAFVWHGPEQWMMMQEAAARPKPDPFTVLAASAFLTDQSDGRCIFRISGPAAPQALAKGLPIDLHPRAFGAGDVALTIASHVNVTIWQVDSRPTYELAVFRGYAASFLHWLEASCAEFGMDIIATTAPEHPL